MTPRASAGHGGGMRPPLLRAAAWTGVSWMAAAAITAALVLGLGAGVIR